MSRRTLTETLERAGVEDGSVLLLASDVDYYITNLESKVANLEEKLLTLKIFIGKCIGGICPICGAMSNEPCDAGLHG